MKKDSKSKFSSNGWIWAEFDPDGKVHYNVSKKGEGCVSCHSTSPLRPSAILTHQKTVQLSGIYDKDFELRETEQLSSRRIFHVNPVNVQVGTNNCFAY